ncbi:flagellar hook-associated protein 2 [Alkalibacillus salilacus]|uniref:Flagellar hook-associated protein 2 n=2 Tax=Alkalibacillus salilacus TaxID=284582 RepID=A0ABT9VFH2_9BACI|nr:flagellar hook-associated protein 2 [Alkalibacillus salilacus]
MDNSMRMTGFASGMDVESMVNQLMEAERQPLQKMEQDQKWVELQRDAYREANTKLSELDGEISNMQQSSTYLSKSTESSNEEAITATAGQDSETGNYSIDVEQLATAAIKAGDKGAFQNDNPDFDPLESLNEQGADGGYVGEEISLTYHNEEGAQDVSFTLDEGDSLSDVFSKISNQSDGNLRGMYDQNSDRVIIERTEEGSFNENGDEIEFNSSFFDDVLNMNGVAEEGGNEARFNYNGIEMTSQNNNYELNGVNFEFHAVTGGNPTNITVGNDVDAAMEQITGFIDKYNETIDYMNGKTSEEKNRDYPPLTERQTEEMSEREIELWQEKSQSGLLRSDSTIEMGVSSMRSSWYESVEGTGNEDIKSVLDVGITTSSNWRDNGKLEVDEAELRQKLQEDPEAVMNLFHNSSEGEERGITQRVEDSLDSMMNQITDRAGNEFQQPQQYTLGRELVDMAERMSNFERRMQQTEQRYWDQFTRMEQAVQEMNSQSQQMQQQLGGMM